MLSVGTQLYTDDFHIEMEGLEFTSVGDSINTVLQRGAEDHLRSFADRVYPCDDMKNRIRAMQILRAKLFELQLEEQQNEIAGRRKAQVGSGARSEKIRTYNWKDSRVSDHRLGQNFPLDNFIGGDIGPAIGGCQAMEQQEMLEELNSEMSM